ncbi:MAG: hypothetical protein ACOCWM_00465 [Cyclobacteriaceae bacterium]
MKTLSYFTQLVQKINWKAVAYFIVRRIQWKKYFGLIMYWLMRSILSITLGLIIGAFALFIFLLLVYLTHDPTLDFSGFD